jgi:hypothetical protein
MLSIRLCCNIYEPGVHDMSTENSQQASRLRPVPQELERFIRLANALPSPEGLPGAEPKDRLPVREHWDSDEAVVENLMVRFPAFRSFMDGVNVKEEDPVEMVQRCLRLKTIRSILYTIARIRSDNQLTSGLVLGGADLENLVSVRSDTAGILRIEHDSLLRALEGVEARRIRECPICGALYWAGRLDKPACKTECDHVLRQRRYREKYSEKYKLQRYRRAEEMSPHEAS